jgi:hypothetical protein
VGTVESLSKRGQDRGHVLANHAGHGWTADRAGSVSVILPRR